MIKIGSVQNASNQHIQACSALAPIMWTSVCSVQVSIINPVIWAWMSSVTWGVWKCICPREISQGGHPPYRERCQWLICVDKNYYKMLIIFNCTKHLIFIEILHLHKFIWGLCFRNQIHKSTNMKCHIQMNLLDIKKNTAIKY